VVRVILLRVFVPSQSGHAIQRVIGPRRNLTFYIKHSRAGQARLEPSLPKPALPEELKVDNLMIKAKPFVEWSAYFEGLKAKKESEDALRPHSISSTGSWEN
jgi:hypothetical protein